MVIALVIICVTLILMVPVAYVARRMLPPVRTPQQQTRGSAPYTAELDATDIDHLESGIRPEALLPLVQASVPTRIRALTRLPYSEEDRSVTAERYAFLDTDLPLGTVSVFIDRDGSIRRTYYRIGSSWLMHKDVRQIGPDGTHAWFPCMLSIRDVTRLALTTDIDAELVTVRFRSTGRVMKRDPGGSVQLLLPASFSFNYSYLWHVNDLLVRRDLPTANDQEPAAEGKLALTEDEHHAVEGLMAWLSAHADTLPNQ